MVARDPETFGLFVAPENPLDIKQVELKGVVELKKFAELVDVSYEELKAINPEILGSYSPPGVDVYKLNVPADDYDDIVETIGEMSPSDLYLTPEQVASLERPPMPRGRGAGRIIYYRVRRGDTIASVARRYHTNSSMIRELNPQLGGGALKPGTTIKVPVGGSRRASGHHRHRRH